MPLDEEDEDEEEEDDEDDEEEEATDKLEAGGAEANGEIAEANAAD